MSAKRILVVEDNPVNRRLFERLLKTLGHDSLLARSGVEGVQRAQDEHPDLVLMDLHMPEMDGYEAARLMREDPAIGSTPIVAVTACAMTGDRDAVLKAGFDGYISKPIMLDEFRAQIALFLGGQAERHE